MNTPPLLIAAVLLFWGWQTGHVVIGALAGLALEAPRVVRMRWSLTQADFNRLWNICSILFLGVGAVLLINEQTVSLNDFFVNSGRRPEAMREAGKSALLWFQWLPMIFFPFVLAQAFNEESKVGLATFSWWLRRQEKRNPNSTLPRESLNVAFPYAGLCLLAASVTTQRGQFFYIGLAALIGWCLWPVRTKRYPVVAWIAAFLIIALAGQGGHTGLSALQKKIEQMDVAWMTQLFSAGADLKEARTRIGAIGALKQSGRIVLRLRTDGGPPPELLREASFSIYRAPLWSNRDRDFFTVDSDDENTTWKLLPRKHATRSLNIAQYLHGGSGLLALPAGSAELRELPAVFVQTNLFGATRAGGAPGLVIYNALYDRGATFDSRTNADDVRSLADSEPAIASVAKEIGLRDGMPASEAMKRVAGYFQEKFQYATYLSADHRATTNETALARFLLRTHSGHCEYFATATALLLRQAGVPTRYAVGYSVQEGSGKKYLVRERHAHAWTLVWDGRNWIDFDTTPGSWSAVEGTRGSWLQPINDFFSDVWFQFSKFRWSKTEWRKYFMWAPVPLLLIAVVRFFFGKEWKKMRGKRKARVKEAERAGIDSDFYLIEKHFAARGLERRTSENWSAWLRRIQEHESAAAQLQRVLRLHQRHRFDPPGLSESERAELRAHVSEWLSAR
jgi:protein-glutamine gamma-glutamyltransferase